MDVKKRFSTKEAADFLGITRQWFWVIAGYHKLEPVEIFGKTKIYKLADLKRIKKLLDAEK